MNNSSDDRNEEPTEAVPALLAARRTVDDEAARRHIDQAVGRVLPDETEDPGAWSGSPPPDTDPPQLPPFTDHVDLSFLLHDPETGEILDANPAAADLYDTTVERLRGADVADLRSGVPDADGAAVREEVRAAAADGPRQFEWRVGREDRNFRWVEARLTPMTLGGRRVVLAETRDVTELKLRERRLRLLTRILRHNLRNDMTVVYGYARKIQRQLDDGPVREQAGTIADVAERVGRLTESVEQIERVARGRARDTTPTDLRSVAGEQAVEVERAYPEASVTVTGDEDVVVAGDESLEYALQQAIENAVEYSEAAAPEATVTVRETADQAVVEVADRNTPIPDIEIEALDDTVETTTTRHGTGAGLFVMKWCTESLGGSLAFHERDPEGNVVEFTFPLLDADA